MTDQLDEFLNLEELIKTYIVKIETLEKDLREKSQILKDTFESDAIYKEHADKAKEANRIKSATKQQILKQPTNQEMDQKVKDLKFDLSEQRAVLADYLTQYQQKTGASQIEMADGDIMEIVTVVRLSRRSSRK
jgi:hypothetical protein